MTDYNISLQEYPAPADALYVSLPYVAVTDSVRTSTSIMLRLLRRPLRYITIDLPPVFSQLRPGQTVWASHKLIPEIQEFDGKVWKLVPLFVLAVTDSVYPAKITLKTVDLRQHYCSWWSPLVTGIGMTADLNGIAKIDRGGGWATTRDQLAYGERPGGDNAYQEVAANTPIIDRFGLLVQGGNDVNLLLNSAFSEGSGNTFTSWTATLSGAAVANEWRLYTLIDAPGFQRAVQIATYATGENAYLTQAAAVADRLHYLRVFYKDGGAYDRMSAVIQRASDSKYWRDSDSTWQATIQYNEIAPGTGVINSLLWVSNAIDPESATTLTVSVGHFAAASAVAQISQIQGVELIDQTVQTGPWCRWRSPLPTKAATVTRVAQVTRIVNDTAVRVLSPVRGAFKVTFQPHWDHADLLNSQEKVVLAADFDEASNSQFFRMVYRRVNSTTGQWRFYRGGVDFSYLATSGDDLATRDVLYNIAARWSSESQYEHDAVGQALDLWVNWVRGQSVVGLTEQSADSACGVYLGCSPNTGATEDEADGHLTDVTIYLHCPTEAQLLRL